MMSSPTPAAAKRRAWFERTRPIAGTTTAREMRGRVAPFDHDGVLTVGRRKAEYGRERYGQDAGSPARRCHPALRRPLGRREARGGRGDRRVAGPALDAAS